MYHVFYSIIRLISMIIYFFRYFLCTSLHRNHNDGRSGSILIKQQLVRRLSSKESSRKSKCLFRSERAGFLPEEKLGETRNKRAFLSRNKSDGSSLCAVPADSRFKALSLFATVSFEFLSSDSRRSRKFMTKWLRGWLSHTIAQGSSVRHIRDY